MNSQVEDVDTIIKIIMLKGLTKEAPSAHSYQAIKKTGSKLDWEI